MSGSEFEEAKNKILEKYHVVQSRSDTYLQKLSEAGSAAWKFHMECYYKGITECVQEFDKLHIESLRINRQKIVNTNDCLNKCRGGRTIDHKRQLLSAKEVSEYRELLECYKPCVESLILHTNKQIEIMDNGLKNLKRFNPK